MEEETGDIANDYLKHAQDTDRDARTQRFRQRLQQLRDEEAGVVAQPPAEAPLTPEGQPQPADMSAYQHLKKIPGALWAGAKDVGYGVVAEGFPAVVAGIYDAGHDTASGVGHAGTALLEWLRDNQEQLGLPDLKSGIPPTGNETVDKLIDNPFSASDLMVDKTPDTQQSTITGKGIREIARFMTLFGPLVRTLGSGPVAVTTAGALTDFLSMDPEKPGIANLLAKVPSLEPYVTPLMINPDDPEIVKRAKHGLEGLGFGALAEGLIRGITWSVKAAKAQKLANNPQMAADQMLWGVTEGVPRDMLMVASPDKQLVLAGTSQGAGGAVDPLMKLAQGADATKTGVPDQTGAKALAGSAQKTKVDTAIVDLRAATDAADEMLEGPAAEAITQFVGHKPGTHKNDPGAFGIMLAHEMEKIARGRSPEAAAAMESAFAPVRQGLREKVGDTITLYRVQPPVKSDPHVVRGSAPEGERAVLSWTANPEFADHAAGITRQIKVYTEEEIQALEKEFAEKGVVQIDKTTKLVQETNEDGSKWVGIYDDKVGGFVTDTDSVRHYLDDPEYGTNASAKEYNAKNEAKRGNIVSAQVPLDDVMWITNRAGQDEFIVKNTPGAPHFIDEKGVLVAKQGEANPRLVGGQLDTSGMTPILREGPQSRGSAGEGPDIFVNFGQIAAPEDVQQVIRDMTDAYKGEINAAKRGVQTNEETQKLATELGTTVEDLLARRKGTPFNAEEAIAARRLLNTSATKLLDLAQKAASPNATLADGYNFRRMMAVHQAIQSEVLAARTETARALQSWSIPTGGGNMEMARNIQMLMETMGGKEVTSELAKRLATLSGQNVPPGALANMVRRGVGATTMDMVRESYTMGLLWNPATHFVNFGSNTAVAFQQVYERGLAAKFGNWLGADLDNKVVEGEALAMAYGMITSMKESWAAAGRALITGKNANVQLTDNFPRAISAEAIARERQLTAPDRIKYLESGMGQMVDFLGEMTRIPGRALGASDEFFKSNAFRAEVHAQSLRQATQEGATGPELYRRMLEIANNPPEHIRMAAADAALYATFQSKPGRLAQGLMQARDSGWMNPLFLVAPFIQTPAGVLRYNFERSPLAFMVKSWRDDIAAGGPRQQLALARMSSGTAIWAIALDYANSGDITGAGPSDPGQREALERTGWKPWTIRTKDGWVSYNRADPFGMALAAAGVMAEAAKGKELSPEDFDSFGEMQAHIIAGLAKSVTDKTFFKGVSNVIDAIEASKGGNESKWEQLRDKTTGALLPFSSAFSTVERYVDPKERVVIGPDEALMARIAGLSTSLKVSRDLWGQERQPDEVYGRLYDVISPIAVSKRKVSPIDEELKRLQYGPKRIQSHDEFMGVSVNFRDFPKVWDEYERLAGNELIPLGMELGLKDYLNDVVSGTNPYSDFYYGMYSDGPHGEKRQWIENTIGQYRKAAQQEIWETAQDKYPEFYAFVSNARAKADALKMPVDTMDQNPAMRPGDTRAGKAVQPAMQ